MKVLYLYDKYPGTYQSYLIEPMKQLRASIGLKVLCYKNHEEADYQIIYNDLASKRYGLIRKLGFKTFERRDLEIMMEYDILHLQHSYLYQKILPVLSYKERPKIVITMRGSETYVKPWYMENWQLFYRDYAKLIDAFVVMSENQSDYLQRWGVEKNQIHEIPISLPDMPSKEARMLNEGTIKFVSAFRLTWEKGIERNLAFVKNLVNQGLNIQYDIFGSGNEIGKVLFLIDDLGLKDVVRLNDKIPHDKWLSRISEYDYYLQLSYTESLGMAVIEALSQGVPAIVSDAGGLPEVVQDKSNGYILSRDESVSGNRILDLLQNSAQYSKLSNNAILSVADKYTVKEEVGKLKKLYFQLLENSQTN